MQYALISYALHLILVKWDTTPPTATPYPRAEANEVYEDAVVKVFLSEPVTGVDATTLYPDGRRGHGRASQRRADR